MNEIVNNIINDIEPISGTTIGLFQFNDFDLTSLCGDTEGYMIKSGNELSLDNTILEAYVSQIIDGGTVIDKRYGNKTVSFGLFIQGLNPADLITKIQSLKQNVNGKNGNLYVTRAGVIYSYTATCSNVVIPSFPDTDSFVDDVKIDFIITSPHGTLLEPEVSYSAQIGNFQKVISNTGNYKSYPIIIMVGKAGASITDINIELMKVGDVSGESIFINNSLVTGDVLILDYNLKTVKLNGVELNFSGFMTPLQVGQNVFTFTMTGTVDVDVYILYNKTFL